MSDFEGKPGWLEITPPAEARFSALISSNPTVGSIRIKYFRNQQTTTLFAKLIFGDQTQGNPNMAHGSAVSAVLYELCSGLVCLVGHQALAIKLEAHFILSVPLNEVLTASTSISHQAGSKLLAEALLTNCREQILAKASILFADIASQAEDLL